MPQERRTAADGGSEGTVLRLGQLTRRVDALEERLDGLLEERRSMADDLRALRKEVKYLTDMVDDLQSWKADCRF